MANTVASSWSDKCRLREASKHRPSCPGYNRYQFADLSRAGSHHHHHHHDSIAYPDRHRRERERKKAGESILFTSPKPTHPYHQSDTHAHGAGKNSEHARVWCWVLHSTTHMRTPRSALCEVYRGTNRGVCARVNRRYSTMRGNFTL